MKKLSLITFLLSLFLSFNVDAKLDTKGLKKWLKEDFHKVLPGQLAELWRFHYQAWPNGAFRLKVRDTSESYCVRLGGDNTPGTYTRKLYVNARCLNQSDWNNVKERRASLEDGRFFQGLVYSIVHVWSNEHGMDNRIFSIPLVQRKIYEKNFFNLPWDFDENGKRVVNVDQSFEGALRDFWKKASYMYMADATLVTRHPRLYLYMRDTLFRGREYIFHTSGADHDLLVLAMKQKEPVNTAKVEYLREGNKAYWTRFKLISEAKKSIKITYFSFFREITGNALLGLLLEKLAQGVRVQLMVDRRGTFTNAASDWLQELVAYGAEIVTYNPFFHWTGGRRIFEAGPLKGIMASNHDKMLLVDDKYFVTGGRNIGDKYFVEADEYDGRVFTDLDVFIEFERYPIDVLKSYNFEFYSPAVRKLRKDLFGNWKSRKPELELAVASMRDRFANEELKRATLKYAPELDRYKSLQGYYQFENHLSEEAYEIIGIDNSSAYEDISEIPDKIFEMIDNAKDVIYLQNPYLVLTTKMKAALARAGARGVRIVMSVTSQMSTDSVLTQAILLGEWKDILKTIPNSEIYAFLGPTQLHSKLFVIDRKYSIIGSYNMDNMSESINSEFSVVINSEVFAKTVMDDVESMMLNNSFKYDLENNIGPSDIPNSTEEYKKTHKFYWFAKLVRRYI